MKIITKYRHKQTGAIAEKGLNIDVYYVTLNNSSLGWWNNQFIENTNDWEKVFSEKDLNR